MELHQDAQALSRNESHKVGVRGVDFMGSIVNFRSASSCPCAGYCGEDSAISPGPVHRRQLCQPHPSNSACMRLHSDIVLP